LNALDEIVFEQHKSGEDYNNPWDEYMNKIDIIYTFHNMDSYKET
jgi:hypothetical protein